MRNLIFIVLILRASFSIAQISPVDSLANEAGGQIELGNYEFAAGLLKDAAAIYLKSAGIQDEKYCSFLEDIASNYQRAFMLDSALAYQKKALELEKIIYPDDKEFIATSLYNIGYISFMYGQFSEADAYFSESLGIYSNIYGIYNAGSRSNLNALAVLHYTMGQYEKCEEEFMNIIMINDSITDIYDPAYAEPFNSLGAFYEQTGQLQKAEEYLLQALRYRKIAVGEDHPRYAYSLNNLAQVYRKLNMPLDALRLFKQALGIFNTEYGENNFEYITALNNVALAYDELDSLETAVTLYEDILNLFDTIGATDHPNYAQSMVNLALVLQKQSEIAQDDNEAIGLLLRADSFFIKARSILIASTGRNHTEYASMIHNFSGNNLLLAMRAPSEKEKKSLLDTAGSQIEESLRILEGIYDGPSLGVTSVYLTAASYNEMTGKIAEATNQISVTHSLISREIKQYFTFLSEYEKEQYLKKSANDWSSVLSFVLRNHETDNSLADIAFDICLKQKGLLLNSSKELRNSIAESKDENLQNLFQEYVQISQLLSSELLKPANERSVNTDSISKVKQEIEKSLIKKTSSMNLPGCSYLKEFDLSYSEIAKNLKKDEAIVEFIRFENSNNLKKGKPVYCALIGSRKLKHPAFVYVCSEDELNSFFQKTTGKNDYYSVWNRYGSNSKPSTELYNLIFAPVSTFIASYEKVYLSPAGLLNNVSFDALSADGKSFLNDKFRISVLSSSANLQNDRNDMIDKFDCLLAGGIQYNDSLNLTPWKYLKGSYSEVLGIDSMLNSVGIESKLLLGNNASEEELTSLLKNYAPSVLHISTHGFAIREPGADMAKILKDTTKYIYSLARSGNGLVRSGLVMANGNIVWNTPYLKGFDALLTAEEVSVMNLSKTKLAILSACRTASGDIHGNEGVYGLQRGFKLAGVEYLLVTLWEVSDEETVEFMELFYNKLLTEKQIEKAFHAAKDELRKKYDPFYWAAFTLLR